MDESKEFNTFTALNYGNIGVENDTNFPGNRANAFTWTGKMVTYGFWEERTAILN